MPYEDYHANKNNLKYKNLVLELLYQMDWENTQEIALNLWRNKTVIYKI